MPALNRSAFIALGAAVPGIAAPGPAFAQTPSAQTNGRALSNALVLSGGGALGAYEAGAVGSLVAQGGIRDGQPLAPYGVVCGTSIGALNAFLVATAQYSKLRDLWSTIAAENVIRVKPKYAKIREQSSGVLTRASEAIGLAFGLDRDVTGIFDGQHLRAWLLQFMDFSRPIVMPMVWAVTNLTMARPEYFYLPAATSTGVDLSVALASLQLSVGPDVPLRRASPDLLVDQLRASAAAPLAFDPVMLDGPDGKPAAYVDGGVTANTPVDVARALALRIDAILLNPAFQAATYRSGLEIAEGTFDTMQRRLMENSLRSAYFESFALRALRQLPPDFNAGTAAQAGIGLSDLRAIEDSLTETALYVMRPERTLPAKLFGFDDAPAIGATYRLGEAAGQAGFVRYQLDR